MTVPGLKENRLLVAWFFLIMTACKHDPIAEAQNSGEFPAEVGAILLHKCATTGCHTSQDKEGCGGLSLESWQNLLDGGRNNAAIVPFSPGQSTLLFYINTDTNLGPALKPTMPYGKAPLSKKEVSALKEWIMAGAPSANGNIAFSDSEKKMYVLNSLCNIISVFDLESGLMMRAHEARQNSSRIGTAVSVSDDGTYTAAIQSDGNVHFFETASEKYNTSTALPFGIWRTLRYSHIKHSFVAINCNGTSDMAGGAIAFIDDNAPFQHKVHAVIKDSLYFPMGFAEDQSKKHMYTACFLGNFIYKYKFEEHGISLLKKIGLDGNPIQFNTSEYRPVDLLFDSTGERILVACQRKGDIRVIDSKTDNLIKSITVGAYPSEMVLDENLNLLFVSCTEDVSTFELGKGSVYIIDLTELKTVKTIYTGYQPKGMALDKKNGFLYVSNRNADPVGADAPHHYTECEGNNGYITRIDLSTLTLDPDYKAEVSVDPSSIAILQ